MCKDSVWGGVFLRMRIAVLNLDVDLLLHKIIVG